jgi:hypothetical protein
MPGYILIIKSNQWSERGDYKTIAELRLKTTNGIIVSKPYTSYINENSFYLNAEYEKGFNLFSNSLRMTLLEK